MDEQIKESDRKKFLAGLLVVLLCILGVVLWRVYLQKPTEKQRAVEAPPPKEEVEEPASKKELAEPVKSVLRSPLAGRWYSDDANVLNSQLAGFFQKADVVPKDDVIALILPHAGYAYSGQTAAFGVKAAGREYKRIIIIGPSHRVPMEDVLSVPRVTHYETPLGEIPLDVEFINKLLEYSPFQNYQPVHKYEHSVQIEAPLLQYGQKDFKLVPIVAGDCSRTTISKVAGILKSQIGEETLLIASSDFVHYGPNYGFTPFKEYVPVQIKELDMTAYEYISKLDSEGFLDFKASTGATICGWIPIAILLSMLDEPVECELLKYETSGQLMNDFTNSVSYLAVAFGGKWGTHPRVEPSKTNPGLSEKDKEKLLDLARKSMVYALEKREMPRASNFEMGISEAMNQPGAAFITLKKEGRLRGCIGDIFPRRPLYKSVISNTINACVNDRRFRPMTIAECNDVTIEISALTEPKPVEEPEEIRIGTDGIVLRKDGQSAVYLPQVAPEQGWDLETTLKHLSKKAGLGEDSWKEGAVFLVFQAEVFGERER